MSVYVDDLGPTRPTSSWQFREACHMLADGVKELHEMAGAIGLQRSWFQPESSPHYDLTPGKRRLAVLAGAIELDRIDMVNKIRELRVPLKEKP